MIKHLLRAVVIGVVALGDLISCFVP